MIWLNCPSHRPLQAPIAAQLLARVACCCRRGRHARGGAHLWADRFDGALEDAFELQDQVTSSVVSALGPTIERAEIARSFEKPTEILQAYDHYLQGLAYFYRYAKDANEKALEHFQSAARADQDYARALVQSALCLSV